MKVGDTVGIEFRRIFFKGIVDYIIPKGVKPSSEVIEKYYSFKSDFDRKKLKEAFGPRKVDRVIPFNVDSGEWVVIEEKYERYLDF